MDRKLRISAVFTLVFTAVLFVFLEACINGCNPEFSEGDRSGVVIKLSKKGLIWRSWEGELNMGYAAEGNEGVTMKIWEFSTEDPEVAKKLEEAQRSGKRVTLGYRQWWMSPARIDSSYVITAVR